MVSGREERKLLIRKMQAEHCKECEQKSGKKDIDECFNCSWHKNYNALYRHEE